MSIPKQATKQQAEYTLNMAERWKTLESALARECRPMPRSTSTRARDPTAGHLEALDEVAGDRADEVQGHRGPALRHHDLRKRTCPKRLRKLPILHTGEN